MFRSLAAPFKEFGFATGLLYVVSSALARASSKTRLFAYDLVVQPISESPLLDESRTKSRLMMRRIEQGEPVTSLMPVATDVINARLRQGAVCLGAFRGDDLVGYIWYSPGEYQEDEVRCAYVLEPAAQSVFDFDLYILPKYRLGRAFAGIWDAANAHLRERRVTQSFSRISRFNSASLRAHAHLGCRRLASAIFLRAGVLQLMFASAPPYLHLSLSNSDSARLRLTVGEVKN